MKKTTFLLGLCTLFFSSQFVNAQPHSYSSENYFSETHLNYQTNYEAAVATARSTSKPIMIIFTGTSWCPACMKLEKEVLSQPEFARAVGNQLIFLKAEFPSYTAESIDASPYKHLLDRYHVELFPTLVVINAEGQQLFTINYQTGGPQAYINEISQKLGQTQNYRRY